MIARIFHKERRDNSFLFYLQTNTDKTIKMMIILTTMIMIAIMTKTAPNRLIK